MIKSIKKIKNIRNLIDFQSLNDLTANSKGESGKIKNSIIYALNGTGKTTISRLLSFLQSDKIDIEQLNDLISVEATDKHEKIQFEIELVDGTIISEQKVEVPNSKFFFVYNEDFLKQNIDIPDFCENKKHNGEIVVGTVDSNEIKIKFLEKQKREHEKLLKIEKGKIETGVSERLKTFKKEYGAKGNTYDQILSEENFYKIDIISELKAKLGESNPKTIFKDIENIDENDKIKNVLSKLNDILFDDLVTNNIHKNFKFEDIQKEVEEHIEKVTKKWIEYGLSHCSDEKCPFCRQSISNVDIIKIYQEYIDSEKSKTITKLNEFEESLNNVINTIKSNQIIIDAGLDKNIASLSKTLAVSNNWNEVKNISSIQTDIEDLIEIIKNKKKDLENDFNEETQGIKKLSESIKTFVNNYNESVTKNNTLINTINTKLTSTAARKTELRKDIIEYELVQYHKESDAIRKEIERLNSEIKKTDDEIIVEKSKSKTKEKKQAISDLQNKLLKKIGLDKYKVDGEFELKLQLHKNYDISKKTKLISQGEKSVIAFTYFLAQTIQKINKYEDFANTSFIIDDPISSISYNYLHGIASVLKSLPKIYQEVYENKGNIVNPQIIITTHNLQFYNILNSNVFKKNSNFYNLIKRLDKIELIKNNGNKLSEYMTSLQRLTEFKKGAIEDNVGIDLRKVLETVCSFHFYDLSQENIEKIFELDDMPVNLKLVADDYIHEDFNNYEDPIDSNALKLATEELLGLIENKFPGQLKHLEKLN
jgi:wobble nucleotide-excising tRNase